MLPFNESCFRVLHSIMVKKKAIHKFHCTQFHSSASALLVFSVQESKNGETLKNNQPGTFGNSTVWNTPKTSGIMFCHQEMGEKLSELVGCREKNGMAGTERRKRALVSFGAEQGLDHGRMAAATPEHPLPGASSEQGSLVFWRENAQGQYFWC